MRDTLLIIDHKEINRLILKKIFINNYHILEAENEESAIKIIDEEKNSLAIVLLDISSSNLNDSHILNVFKEKGYLKRIPVILITDDSAADLLEKKYENWVADVITKPYETKVIRRRVRNIVDLYVYNNELESLVYKQTQEIRQKSDKLRENNVAAIEALSTVAEFRGLESGEHIKRVKKLTRDLLVNLNERFPAYNMTKEQIDKIAMASSLHDVGKITVPDNILLKPGKLTSDEFEIMKLHTVKGCNIIKSFTFIDDDEFMDYSYHICKYHHERYDGHGYPEGLKGNEIPICAQIVSIADVYDALISEKVYKAAFKPKEAYRMILSGECGVFAPEILETFRTTIDKQINNETIKQ